MSLKHKMVVNLCLGWLVLILSEFFLYYYFLHFEKIFNLAYYLMLSILLLNLIGLLLLLIYIRKYLFQRIEAIKSTILLINQNYHLDDNENNILDELEFIHHDIKYMSNLYKSTRDQLEFKLKSQSENLQDVNAELQREISERVTLEKELLGTASLISLSHFDKTTSLPNRIYFNQILNKAITQAKRHNKYFALLFIDLDNFKKINKNIGFEKADLILKEVGNRIVSIIRAGDIVARLGGDEFIILLNDIDRPKYSGPIAKKILAEIANPIIVEDKTFILKSSIGICIYPNDGHTLEILQRHADLALYKAKKDGGGKYSYYMPEMDIAAREHIKFEEALRTAINDNALQLFYQPQYNLMTGNISAVESLIRWPHPQYGLISPEKFIPLAEETGLIMPLGEWIINEACRINKEWQDQGFEHIIIAVNISPKQFKNQNIPKIIEEALIKSKLDPKYLEIEITETFIMENADANIEILQAVHDMGVRISIDDFGTGYTSINYLRRFPLNALKIDQSFIKGIPQNKNDLAIVIAVIELGHNLGLEIVAEGIENTEQIEFLAGHKCDFGQGYFLSLPLSATKIISQFSKI